MKSKDTQQNDETGPSSNHDEDLEEQLFKLRAIYNEMKKDRLKAEKDSKQMENKLKMLETEEKKMFTKFSKEKKFKEEWEQARQRTIEFRNHLNQVKFQRKQDQYENAKKIKQTKENMQKNLKDSRMMQMQENRLNNLQLKQKKMEDLESRMEAMKIENERNKKIAETVKSNEKSLIEKKKQADLEKKMKLKMELEKKVLEEQKKKYEYDNQLVQMEEAEIEFLKKMKTTLNESVDEKYRSCSSGPVSSSKKVKTLNTSVN